MLVVIKPNNYLFKAHIISVVVLKLILKRQNFFFVDLAQKKEDIFYTKKKRFSNRNKWLDGKWNT